MTGRDRPSATVWGLLDDISGIGRDASRGGYSRPLFSTAELDLREWFTAEAARRGLDIEVDPNGIIWAWWRRSDQSSDDAVITGSHLDSVPGGGPFDGPLGVASALVAVDVLRSRGFQPERPVVLAVFPEEEGSRFGVPCLGSRLLTGAISADRALALKDGEGDTYADLARRAGFDPSRIGADHQRLRRGGSFVELHVEQGRGLIDRDSAVAIGSSILGHGRWKLSVHGTGNHAGTTLMQDRADPLLAASRMIVRIREAALGRSGARATVGRVEPTPNGTNVIASRVDLWLDVRHADDLITAALVAEIERECFVIAAEEGCTMGMREESLSPTVRFDQGLKARLEEALPGAPVLDTGAGHDAGVLASVIPTAMLFVRNPTGISHSPEELIEPSDAEAGAQALADVLEHLASRSGSGADRTER